MSRFRFKVIQAPSPERLEKLLNEWGADGWHLHGWHAVQSPTVGVPCTYVAVISKAPND